MTCQNQPVLLSVGRLTRSARSQLEYHDEQRLGYADVVCQILLGEGSLQLAQLATPEIKIRKGCKLHMLEESN